MIHTAVEGMINGSFGILTARQDNLESEGRIVYITRTVSAIMKRTAGTSEKVKSIIIEEAEGSGYTPCKVCKPLG